MAAPMSASFCASSDCSPGAAKSMGPCTGMDMPKPAASLKAPSQLACCQMTPSLPATVGQNSGAQSVKAELSTNVSTVPLVDVVATRVLVPRSIQGPPTHDLQSLLCILLI